MANGMYPKSLSSFLTKGIDCSADDIRILLLTSGQAFNSAHQFVSDLTAGNIIQRGGAGMTTKTTVSGVFKADNYTLTAVAAGSTVAALVIYDNTPALDSAKNLIAWIDHDSGGAAISLATNGSDITVTMNASGYFSI